MIFFLFFLSICFESIPQENTIEQLAFSLTHEEKKEAALENIAKAFHLNSTKELSEDIVEDLFTVLYPHASQKPISEKTRAFIQSHLGFRHENNISFALNTIEKEPNNSLDTILDIYAACILHSLPANASAKDKIEALSHFIFFIQQFHFPKNPSYQKYVDRYTTLSSVVGTKQGVCLGVSLLLYSLAQRLGVHLDIYTPHGHIILGYEDQIIEPTARGWDIEKEHYLIPGQKELKKREEKELLALFLVNKASSMLERNEIEQAAETYKKALLFAKNDLLLHEFFGVSLFLLGKKGEAKKHLQRSLENKDHDFQGFNLASDILNKRIDKESIKLFFIHYGDRHQDHLEEKEALEKALKRSPHSRCLLFSLYGIYEQLSLKNKAHACLEQLYKLDEDHFLYTFLLAHAYAEEEDMQKALFFLQKARTIAEKKELSLREIEESETLLLHQK